MNRIDQLFSSKEPDQKIMSLFITAGFPEQGSTVPLVLELASSGADIIELGMPFSDPLADGPTIQSASKIAIEQGVHIDSIFRMVSDIRKKSETPIVLMGYINPVLHYGLEAFFSKACESGVDGVILPDVPPGEMEDIADLCARYRIAPINLVAPNTPDSRMIKIDQTSRGFVYCVSVAGVTGVREGSDIEASVQQFIHRVKENVKNNPVLIGFGIRNHDDAMKISRNVDGFIVGSALIDYIASIYPDPDWITKTGQFVRKLKGF